MRHSRTWISGTKLRGSQWKLHDISENRFCDVKQLLFTVVASCDFIGLLNPTCILYIFFVCCASYDAAIIWLHRTDSYGDDRISIWPLQVRKYYLIQSLIYSFAFVWAFLRIGSIFVAFITSPLTFSFPDMNSRCAFALPLTSFPKSSSDSVSVTK